MPKWNWPALIVGLLMAVYWARVVYMVRRTRRRTGHGANFFPPEPLGRILRLLWIPAVGLWIALPLAATVPTKCIVMRTPFYSPWVAWIALLIAVAAFVATLICWAKMGNSWRMGIDPGDKTQLISTGPYAYLRHPIYALSSLLMLMTILIVPSPAMLAVGAVHLVLLQWEARREEKYLLGAHGEEYRAYCARTGRFLPRFL